MEKVKYPPGEIVWAGYYNKKGELLFIVTSKAAREWYYLYEYIDGSFKKSGREKEPSILVKRYEVSEKMRVC